MQHRIACGLSVMALLSSVGLAGPAESPETLDERVPLALVSPDGLAHRAIAETLFQGLPAAQQAEIAAAGAIGPRAPEAPDGVGVLASSRIDVRWGEPETWLEPETLAVMLPEHLAMFRHFADLAARGEPVPQTCLSPDTDPKIAEAFFAFFDGIQGGPERYQFGTRWSRTALSGSGLSQGDPTIITYSFVPDGTQIPNLSGQLRPSDMQAWLDSIYGASTWPTLFANVFNQWSVLTGLTYVFEPNDTGTTMSGSTNAQGVDGVRGDVRIGATRLDGNSNVLAFNNFPNNGDMVIDSDDNFFNFTSQNFRRFRNVVAHEAGHGIGAAHVCPIQQTKLMEPFITTSFNGPQLDDTLFGQRAYGDPIEPNDDLAGATPLGLLAQNDSAFFRDISIDDDSDEDVFSFEVTLPVEITAAVTPAAASYLNGPQNSNGSCSSGTTLNYNTRHDLVIEFLDGSGSVIATFNDSPIGSVESGQAEYFDPGTYYLRVSSATIRNDVQLYDLDVSSQLTVAPLEFTFLEAPAGEVAPDTAPVVAIDLDERDDTVLQNPELTYSLNGAGDVTVPLQFVGSGRYETTLPTIACGSVLTYRVDVEGTLAGPIELGPNTLTGSLGVARLVQVSDNFEADNGWSVSGTITSDFFGQWERVDPAFATTNAPTEDADGSGTAWITGDFDVLNHVSGGSTILTSPSFDLAGAVAPEIQLSTWFDDDSGLNPGSNIFVLEISGDDGANWSTLDVLGPGGPDAVGGWIERTYPVRAILEPTAAMRVRAIASDAGGSAIYEAGIDGFAILDPDCNPPSCPVDLNGDGVADNGDIGAFIGLFLASDPSVDFNNDSIIDNGDIGAFIGLFLAGC